MMKKVVIVSRNILDSSRIENDLKRADIDVQKFSSTKKLIELIDSHLEEICAFVDFSLFDSPDDIVELIPNVDDENIRIIIFGPHELMNELTSYYPTISFVARSLFFRDPVKYI